MLCAYFEVFISISCRRQIGKLDWIVSLVIRPDIDIISWSYFVYVIMSSLQALYTCRSRSHLQPSLTVKHEANHTKSPHPYTILMTPVGTFVRLPLSPPYWFPWAALLPTNTTNKDHDICACQSKLLWYMTLMIIVAIVMQLITYQRLIPIPLHLSYSSCMSTYEQSGYPSEADPLLSTQCLN